MIKNIEISIIIVNYNTMHLVNNCIESIFNNCKNENYEIIVVDNDSKDKGQLNSKYLSNSRVSVIYNAQNVGFGTANNIGVQEARGDYLLLLNSDTIVKKDILSLMKSEYLLLKQNYKIGCIGLTLLDVDENVAHSGANFAYPFSKRVQNEQIINMPPNVKRCDIVIGADMFILKSLFHALGGFDENIFLYEEELELQYRMRLEGYVNFILNDIGIIHLEGKSSTSYFHQICTFKSMCYILKKHFGCFQLLRYRLRTIVRAFLSVIKYILDPENRSKKFDFFLFSLKYKI